MSQRPAVLVSTLSLLSACSFIYNPDHIGSNDASVVDTEVVADVDPTALHIMDVWPQQIFEGAGTGGSRAALIVIYGAQIAPDATVTLTGGTTDAAHLKITSTTIAADHNFAAITVEADDDGIQNHGTNEHLTLAISQSAGMYTAALDPQQPLDLVHLDSLSDADMLADAPTVARYSQIHVSAITFNRGAAKKHVALRAVGSIIVDDALHADALAGAPGPGGCAGGAVASDGADKSADMFACTGRGFTVAGGLLNGGGGGGAGFVDKGGAGLPAGTGGLGGDTYGAVELPDLSKNAPSGGGGGAPASIGGGGAAGGGGGGLIEITAGGDVTITNGVTAHGGKGTDAANGGAGGGGDGGTILIRAGATAMVGPLDVARGENGVKSGSIGSGVPGGPGSVGRTRVDAANQVAVGDYHGPMFVTPAAVTTTQMTSLMIRGVAGDGTVQGQAYDRDGDPVTLGAFTPTFNGMGLATSSLGLKAGYNKVCVWVKDGNPFLLDESVNCTEIAFLP